MVRSYCPKCSPWARIFERDLEDPWLDQLHTNHIVSDITYQLRSANGRNISTPETEA